MKLLPTSSLLSVLTLASLLILSSCDKDDSPEDNAPKGPDLVFYGLTAANQLVKYNANAPGSAIATTAISNLQTGENLIGIDFRPATGQLFGIGSASRLYTINTTTGKADTVASAPFSPALPAGSFVGFDFNPTVDRIRVVTGSGQNFRLNPENGVLAATDAALNPGTPVVTGAAYTNSTAGATSTILYDLDVASQKLYKQDPPNNGTLVEVGALGITATGDAGFDISPDNSAALAALTVGGVNGLYSIDLTTGKATFLGKLATAIIGLAIPTNAVAYSIDNSTNNLLIFNFNAAATPVSKAITNLQPSETILGIDMRPKTGQVFALGSSSRIYTINISTGAATAVGSQFATLLDGESFGFDFNPTVDRIRVTSNKRQNLRLNPITGGIAAVDAVLNPGTPAVSASAYTNNFAGSTATVLFNIDHATDKLYTQNPPNDGVLVEVGTAGLGVNVEATNGFDIGGTSNAAFAILTVGSVSKVYSINLTTGAATAVVNFPGTARGFTIGLGF
ncbi:MAG: DUF4394 domain-containing protein [Chitinophagaceae bacterium]|nr:DUF4394 domain-containing protein [Chitinophagaceae bacterium]